MLWPLWRDVVQHAQFRHFGLQRAAARRACRRANGRRRRRSRSRARRPRSAATISRTSGATLSCSLNTGTTTDSCGCVVQALVSEIVAAPVAPPAAGRSRSGSPARNRTRPGRAQYRPWSRPCRPAASAGRPSPPACRRPASMTAMKCSSSTGVWLPRLNTRCGALARRCRRMVERAEHAGDDVVDEGEVAPHPAVVEHLDRAAGQHRAREQQRRHVRAAPRAVHGEEAQAGRAQAVQVRVGVRHQFVRGLGRGVQRARLVDALVFGERRRRRIAIHRRRTRIHQVLHAAMPAQFEHVDEADQVAVDVGVRIVSE